jgi:hypothetical protein
MVLQAQRAEIIIKRNNEKYQELQRGDIIKTKT